MNLERAFHAQIRYCEANQPSRRNDFRIFRVLRQFLSTDFATNRAEDTSVDEGEASMTIEEYKAEVKRHDTATFLRMLASIAILFVFGAAVAIIRFFDDTLGTVLAPIFMCVGFPLMFLGFRQADRTYRGFPALICRHCDGSIARNSATVIATGNCPNCGRRVLADDSIGT
ncbi:MAG: hypothetical protein AAGJ83_02925 [Planctomycetota bacterium]